MKGQTEACRAMENCVQAGDLLAFHRLTIFSLETVEHSYEHKNNRRFIDPKANRGERVRKVENRLFFLGSVLTVVLLKHTPNCGGEKLCEQARPLSPELNMLSCSIVICIVFAK